MLTHKYVFVVPDYDSGTVIGVAVVTAETCIEFPHALEFFTCLNVAATKWYSTKSGQKVYKKCAALSTIELASYLSDKALKQCLKDQGIVGLDIEYIGSNPTGYGYSAWTCKSSLFTRCPNRIK